MRSGLKSDVLKIFAYVAATLVLGAIISPWLYQGGKGLAEVFAEKQGNGPVNFVAKAAGRADFPRFFDRSLMLSALVLLFPLIGWLKLGRGPGSFRDTPWSLRLPDSAILSNCGQPLQRNPNGWAHLCFGFFVAAGLLLLSGWVMLQAGCFVWKDAAMSTRGMANKFPMEINWVKALKDAVPGALIVSFIEEILFRGVLLGIFLRAMRPAPAIALLSFLFAFVHFLEPADGAVVPDPEAANAGFILLGQIFNRFADPLSMLSRFSIIAMVGVVLAYARYRTASLWLPIGLHIGWVFGVKMFKAATWQVVGLPEGVQWLIGRSLLEGLLPLSVVGVTGMLVHAMTRTREPVPDYRS